MYAVDYLRGEGKLCQHVLTGLGIAVERVVFRGDIKAIQRLYIAVVILNVETVHLNGHSLDPEALAVVLARDNEAVFRVVGNVTDTELLESPAAGQRIYRPAPSPRRTNREHG